MCWGDSSKYWWESREVRQGGKIKQGKELESFPSQGVVLAGFSEEVMVRERPE